MPIKSRKQTAVPPGQHTGLITGAELTTKVFDPSKGPEEVLEITIQPKYDPGDNSEVMPLAITYSPVINGMSALSGFLKRLGQHPENDEEWLESSIVGLEIAFATVAKGLFVNVVKDTIRPL